MNLFQRSIYFIIGLCMGCFLLFFILEFKKYQFPYGPNARTIRSIIKKPYRNYSDTALKTIRKYNLDSTTIAKIILDAKVSFQKSETDLNLPCQKYWLNGKLPESLGGADCVLEIKRCETVATVTKMNIKK